MLAVVVLALVMMAFAGITTATNELASAAAGLRRENQAAALQFVAEAVETYRLEHFDFPPDLDTVAALPGYEYIKPYVDAQVNPDLPNLRYTVSGVLTDSAWEFKRAVLYIDNSAAQNFLSTNKCGTGDATTAASWCADGENALWNKLETRSSFNNDLADERHRQRALLQRVVNYRNETGGYPAISGSSQTLKDIVGTTLTATTCSGVMSWQGMPVSCEDVFSRWGTETSINYPATKSLAIVADSPVRNSNPTPSQRAIAVVTSMEG